MSNYNVYVQGIKYKVMELPSQGYNPARVYDIINEDIMSGNLVIDVSKPLDIQIRPVGTDLFE